jgi:hypothetical protein
MPEQDNRIILKIDISTGTIELNAPAENFDQAIEKTKELTATLDLKGSAASGQPRAGNDPATSAGENISPTQTRSGAKARPKGKSGDRAGRLGSFEMVDGLLSESEEIALRDYFLSKAPQDQTDKVLVAINKGEELLARKGFTYNEIYMLMWLGGIKDLPKALDVLLLRLLQDQMIVRENGGFAMKFIGRNYVDNNLPKQAKI